MRKVWLIFILGGLLVSLGLFGLTGPSLAQTPTDTVLSDPLVLGAWLYEGHCERCHGAYEQERVGSGFDLDELKTAIGREGCQIKWARQYGGPLKDKEIEAVAAYITAWEELGGPPDLPNLPPQPTSSPTPTPRSAQAGPALTPTPTPELIDERTQLILADNPLAYGAWLYTQHCFRCHQSYAATRQGRDMAAENLQTTIENGKTATQMTPFSRKKGGPLKDSEIKAITDYIITWETMGEAPAIPPGLLVEPTPDPASLAPILPPQIPRVTGDAQRGAALYARHCRLCHGPGGEGQIAPALVKAWPAVRPDLTLQAVIAQGAPGGLMPTWSQANGGPLTTADINHVVSFILNQSGQSPPSAPPAAAVVPSFWREWPGLAALLAGSLLLAVILLTSPPRKC